MKAKWLISDAFSECQDNGVVMRNEMLSFANLSVKTIKIDISLIFEDKEILKGFAFSVPAGRVRHVIMDELKGKNGERVPVNTHYAILCESENSLEGLQYSRKDGRGITTVFAKKVRHASITESL